VLPNTGVRPSARVSRQVGVAGIVITLVCSAAAAPAALADRRPQPNADELWRAYPLEQKPAKTAPAPATGAPRRSAAPAADGGSSNGPPWGLLPVIGGATALLAGWATMHTRRRRAHASGAAPPPPAPQDRPRAEPPPAAPQDRPRAAPPPPAAQDRPRAEPPPAAPQERPQPPPIEFGALAPTAAAANGRPVSARQAPVCQIKWSRRTLRFYAYAIDDDGSQRRLARSAVVDWDQPGPPEETPEARAAIRRLTKDLRERGWRPLRARGIDSGERRWYARRFRWPTEAEAQPGGTGGDMSDQEIAGRPRSAR
jgi:hypothetical protein